MSLRLSPLLPSPLVSSALPPVAVGGVGGSGTRVVAQLLIDLDFFLGADLNESNDNLWFTLLFKRREILRAGDEELTALVTIFRHAMTGPPHPLSAAQLDLVKRLAGADRLDHDAAWLGQRARSLESWAARGGPASGMWGWKEPNTHIVLPRLAPLLPGMKYVHVVRNGLDMAYSSNQAQLHLWGPSVLGIERIEASPRLSLKYWRAVHCRVLEHGRSLGDGFLLLSYDRLCADPEGGLRALLQFLGVERDRTTWERLLASIRRPPSVGRFRQHPPSDFDPDDVAFARDLGFDTEYGRAL